MIDWLDWNSGTFARAAHERKPVLLSITAAWCRACHEMDRTTYADPRVEALVRDRFIPLRVDADRRPDINERYNLGGWPTTAFLTPDGDLMTGGTFVSADRMPAVLTRVVEAFGNGPAAAAYSQSAGSTDLRSEGGASCVPDDQDLVEETFSTFDPEFGGFGVEPKFPHTGPLLLALAL
ncbi:MAG TPA: DUF255 domain-containing protein, partial [Vicinamibacterales bacterium]